MREIIDRPIDCRCGRCEEAVRDILRMERMLCHSARMTLWHRRRALEKTKRQPYYAERYRETKRAALRGGE